MSRVNIKSSGTRDESADENHSSVRAGTVNSAPVLITGGSGFIGTNLAHRLLSAGIPVVLYDNLSRAGVEKNFEWLRKVHGDSVRLIKADVRDFKSLRKAVEGVSQVYHFAAQVAVTTSLVDPVEDFEINARGTLNLLEALRSLESPPPLLFTSTNKVYGDLSEVKLHEDRLRYESFDADFREHGFDEGRALHFHSPYGCSKGAACQYVQDYARTFGLKTVVFRMSCIYGPHQFGTEDQGWVAHFLIKALKGSAITLYGNGKQVRDVLFVEDLVDALTLALRKVDSISGNAYNIGGGPANTTSLLELLNLIGQLCGNKPDVRLENWRPADQKYYVSDVRSFSRATGWAPKVDMRTGVTKLFHWLQEFGYRKPLSRRARKTIIHATNTRRATLPTVSLRRYSSARNGKVNGRKPRLPAETAQPDQTPRLE